MTKVRDSVREDEQETSDNSNSRLSGSRMLEVKRVMIPSVNETYHTLSAANAMHHIKTSSMFPKTTIYNFTKDEKEVVE